METRLGQGIVFAMASFTNVAAYQFAALSDLKGLRTALLDFCKDRELKGTILLSTEGINLFVAGNREGIDSLMERLRAIPGLEDLKAKFSESAHQPFTRALVRIKKEIIAFGVEGIDPARSPAPKLSPATLKQWLDEGRPVTLLDTRNDYEVKLGTFRNATRLGIDRFRDFPSAVGRLPEPLKQQPIVMFCTGGIRCEKAGPYMQQQGFENVFQLEGGILKYFEECGNAHYEGECFVFDQRVGLDPTLEETDSIQCFQCQSPLTAREQEDPRFVAGQSCPYCFKSPAEQLQERLEHRQEKLQSFVRVLPGSLPYDNFRPLSVPTDCEGLSVFEFLGRILPHTPQSEWEELCREGLLLDGQKRPVTGGERVREGNRFLRKLPELVEPDVSRDVRFLYEDEAIVVLHKPAPLPMHPGGRFNRNALQYWMNEVWYPLKPRPAHRLDANTSGVVVFTKTRHFASRLQPQFAKGEVEKTYFVRVSGHPVEDAFVCELPIQEMPSGPGARGVDLESGLAARTEFTVVERCSDGSASLLARPTTGRTHQIRVHLWSLGHPVRNDPTYLLGGRMGDGQTLGIQDPPMCLHAWKLTFLHPISQARVEFSADLPPWSQPTLCQ